MWYGIYLPNSWYTIPFSARRETDEIYTLEHVLRRTAAVDGILNWLSLVDKSFKIFQRLGTCNSPSFPFSLPPARLATSSTREQFDAAFHPSQERSSVLPYPWRNSHRNTHNEVDRFGYVPLFHFPHLSEKCILNAVPKSYQKPQLYAIYFKITQVLLTDVSYLSDHCS